MNRLLAVLVALATWSALGLNTAAERPAQELAPSRSVWWLSQDEVQPIADLINRESPGKGADFVDRIGSFQVTVENRALVVTGEFPAANVWRFDLTTADAQFDMRKLYVPWDKCAFPDRDSIWTRKFTELLGDSQKGITYTGPWATHGGKWLVPTARVALDGKHVYTSWFDQPSIEDLAAGRVYASFALDIRKPGKHTIRIAFDDFPHGTRWRMPRWNGDKKPKLTYSKNDLRPHHIGSIAIGIDERVRSLEDVGLKPALQGKRPRLLGSRPVRGIPDKEQLSIADVESMMIHVDFNRGELWEFSADAESFASANDMDAGKNGIRAAQNYDAYVTRLTPEARREWDRLFLERFEGLYTFFVFQRNYHPTGYAQNHCSATIPALIAAALVWDGPEAEKWLRWSVMTCRKRIELYGHDGGVEWMNEARDYGLAYFLKPLALIQHGTGLDLTAGEPFFENEWRYALYQSHLFPTGDDRRPPMATMGRGMRGKTNPNVPVPTSITPENTPTDYHFTDVDQVFMRSHWGDGAYRTRLWAGTCFGKHAAAITKRYNWAHCRVNQGAFTLNQGKSEIILEPGWTRTYRKTATNSNCIIVNGTDQWGAGHVWHPKLEPEQLSHIASFADGKLMAATRADLAAAYPPEARVTNLSRCVVHLKPDTFLVFDRLETDGKASAQWRFHTAFVDPMTPSDRFTAYGYHAAKDGFHDRSQSYDEAFQKNDAVKCQVAFLTDDVKASVAMTDSYFRWSKFSQPQRHLRVEQNNPDGELTLLTAFGPKLDVKKVKNIYRGSSDGKTWVAIVGPGTAEGLESDGYLAIAVTDVKDHQTEVMRFGGRRLVYNGTEIKSAATDVFADIAGKKVKQMTETLPTSK